MGRSFVGSDCRISSEQGFVTECMRRAGETLDTPQILCKNSVLCVIDPQSPYNGHISASF